MPGGALRLLVAAIIAVALLAIAYYYFLPYFLPRQDIPAIISEGFDKAETSSEKLVPLGKIFFSAGQSFNARSFDSRARTASFKCTSSDCASFSRGDSRTIAFSSSLALEASARCAHEFGLAVCTLYLGRLPAQLEVEEARVLPEKPDFAKTKTVSVEFKAMNSGQSTATESKALVELYRQTEEGKELQDSKQISIGEVEAGESPRQSATLSLRSAGSHEVVISLEGKDAGKGSQSASFIVVDSTPSLCATGSQEAFSTYDSESGKCRTRLYCNSCNYGFECENAWKEKLPAEEITAGDKTLAYKLADSVSGQCP